MGTLLFRGKHFHILYSTLKLPKTIYLKNNRSVVYKFHIRLCKTNIRLYYIKVWELCKILF